jgi:formylglycine-generating enzyme required for sulfatase activity
MHTTRMAAASIVLAFILAACPETTPVTYCVSYDGNGADGGAAPVDDGEYTLDDVVEVAEPGTLNRSGFLFAGWDTVSDGSGVSFAPGDTFSITSFNVTLYAQWAVDPFAGMTERSMVSVPGGTFTAQDNDVSGGSFSATVSPFTIAAYELTLRLWSVVLQWALDNGYTIEGSYGFDPATDARTPVRADWYSAIVWCNAYSEMMGLTPVYSNADGEVIRDARASNAVECESPLPDWEADGYRLPTEVEWQYAASYIDGTSWTGKDCASGSTVTVINKNDSQGNGIEDGKEANDLVAVYGYYFHADGVYVPTSVEELAAVGTKLPNALGLHDMSGNAAEWCWDWHDDWPWDPRTDYRGPASGSERAERGGGFYSQAGYLAVGCREHRTASAYYDGLRLVRTP